MPLLGGYLADTYWGRFRTINYAIAIAIFGHVIIIISALPPIIKNPDGAIGCFACGLIFFGVGVGWFKVNISPLIAEQYEKDHPRAWIETLSSGERVIVDPVLTISRVYVRYYWMINVGALLGQISMVYAEKYVGFWLAFTLPTILFLTCPFIMLICRNKYVKNPPTGSVLGKATKLITLAVKESRANKGKDSYTFWERVMPSNVGNKPEWMTFDDAWVDEVRRGLKACYVFMFMPIYWLSYSQMTNNLVSQASMMRLNGLPNDLVQNLDPIALLIFIPICDKILYPWLARIGIKFTPIKKIAFGFACGCLSMVVACVIQYYIYEKSPCGYYASDSDCIEELGPPDISVWIQTPAYVLIALSEIFASITGLEYAFTKAHKNMRGLVTGVFWFSNAFSSALGQAFVPLATDPHQVWLYGSIAIISFVGGIIFWFVFKEVDKAEEAMNALPTSTYRGRNTSVVDFEAIREEQEMQDKIRKSQGLA